MEIIFHGQQDWQKTQESLMGIIQMLHDKYHIDSLKEIHLSVTLIDHDGFEIDLVDSDTQVPYRVLEVFRNNQELLRVKKGPALSLVIDNTKKS